MTNDDMPPTGRPRKQTSCLGFLAWCVAVVVGFVVVVGGGFLLIHHTSDTSAYSRQVRLQVIYKEPGEQSPKDGVTQMTYRYLYGETLYQYKGWVNTAQDDAQYACVDPKRPTKVMLLDTSDAGDHQCGDKHLPGRDYTAKATS